MRPSNVKIARGLAVASLLLITACGSGTDEAPSGAEAMTGGVAADAALCAPDNGGLTLPAGFCATVVADGVGRARHLAVGADGVVYVMLRPTRQAPGGLVALRDTTGDARADVIESFGDIGGTGVRVHGGYLYAATDTSIVRFPLPADGMVPTGAPEVIAAGFPAQAQHAAKSFVFDEAGHLYVNIGAPSNACQQQMRTPGSPGQDPCPQLDRQSGIWRLDADTPNQTQQADAMRYASGIRNGLALAWRPGGGLYAVQHGRDQLNSLWPDLYTAEQNAELPAEEFFQVDEGDDFGWPFCYYDSQKGAKVLAPEYGGDGQEVGRCAEFEDPIVAFPGHWAPNDLLFYTGEQYPDRYEGGAFIAFHGSWNRAPMPQQGYFVAFVPFSGGTAATEWDRFADGFAGTDSLASPGEARHRPMGLAQGPDGSLYISDSQEGRIWRVMYVGE